MKKHLSSVLIIFHLIQIIIPSAIWAAAAEAEAHRRVRLVFSPENIIANYEGLVFERERETLKVSGTASVDLEEIMIEGEGFSKILVNTTPGNFILNAHRKAVDIATSAIAGIRNAKAIRCMGDVRIQNPLLASLTFDEAASFHTVTFDIPQFQTLNGSNYLYLKTGESYTHDGVRFHCDGDNIGVSGSSLLGTLGALHLLSSAKLITFDTVTAKFGIDVSTVSRCILDNAHLGDLNAKSTSVYGKNHVGALTVDTLETAIGSRLEVHGKSVFKGLVNNGIVKFYDNVRSRERAHIGKFGRLFALKEFNLDGVYFTNTLSEDTINPQIFIQTLTGCGDIEWQGNVTIDTLTNISDGTWFHHGGVLTIHHQDKTGFLDGLFASTLQLGVRHFYTGSLGCQTLVAEDGPLTLHVKDAFCAKVIQGSDTVTVEGPGKAIVPELMDPKTALVLNTSAVEHTFESRDVEKPGVASVSQQKFTLGKDVKTYVFSGKRPDQHINLSAILNPDIFKDIDVTIDSGIFDGGDCFHVRKLTLGKGARASVKTLRFLEAKILGDLDAEFLAGSFVEAGESASVKTKTTQVLTLNILGAGKLSVSETLRVTHLSNQGTVTVNDADIGTVDNKEGSRFDVHGKLTSKRVDNKGTLILAKDGDIIDLIQNGILEAHESITLQKSFENRGRFRFKTMNFGGVEFTNDGILEGELLNRVGRGLRLSPSHTTVRALSHTAVLDLCVTN